MSGEQVKVLCGRTTRKGMCNIPLRAGKCFVHDLTDLKKRNRKVARAFRKHNPEAFTAQRRAAGHRGYLATGGSNGWERANQFAINWRTKHRSEPERWTEQIIRAAGYTGFVLEYQIDGDPRTLDFAFVADHVCVETNGHQDKCAFGETESRAAKHAAKIAWLEALGWKVHVVHASAGADRNAEQTRLLAFLSQFPLRAADENFDELPF